MRECNQCGSTDLYKDISDPDESMLIKSGYRCNNCDCFNEEENKKSCKTCKYHDQDTTLCPVADIKYNARWCGEYELDPFAGEPEQDIPSTVTGE